MISVSVLLLHRYILADLLKVFLLTATVLVTVIAFGATIKPLTDEGFVGPLEAMRYMLMAMVPMLQFALPFSAGFASTIVLHRMTTDNEIQAAAASGISYPRLLAPVIGLGLGLTLLMAVLTQTVIPRFWANMERMIAADVTRMMQHSIENGVPFSMGNLQIHAERVYNIHPVPAHEAATMVPGAELQTRLLLAKVAVVEVDRDGRVDSGGTAEHAVMDIYRVDADTYVKLAAGESVGGDATQWGGLGAGELPQAIVIPSLLRDNLRARTKRQLLEMRDDPERHSSVRDAKESLARAIMDDRIFTTIDRRLHEKGELELVQQSPTRRRYIVRADALRDGVFHGSNHGSETRATPLLVRQFEGATMTRRIAAETVRLNRAGDAADGSPLFELELRDAEVTDLQTGGAVNRRARLMDSGLHLSEFAGVGRMDAPLVELLAAAPARGAPAAAARRVHQRIHLLRQEIQSRILARYAQATTAILLLTLGATLAMWLRSALPLVIYVWAFLPSILNLIMINGGDKMMRDGYLVSGFSVMWGGNAALLLLFLFALWKLSKN